MKKNYQNVEITVLILTPEEIRTDIISASKGSEQDKVAWTDFKQLTV